MLLCTSGDAGGFLPSACLTIGCISLVWAVSTLFVAVKVMPAAAAEAMATGIG
jgi:hypothetical protein